VIGGEETRLYPLFAFARARVFEVRAYYMAVQNETRRVEEAHPRVCALLVAEPQAAGWRPPDRAFEPQWREGPFALYVVPRAR
jgi:hypothetical protein